MQRGLGEGGGPLAHALLGGPGADHQNHQQPEHLLPEQRADGQRLLPAGEGVEGHAGEVEAVGHRHQRPQHRQHRPAFDARQGEEQRGEQYHAQVAPAVEGVQQAHGGLLALGGAGLHDGTDEHLDQPAADGVQHHGDEYACVGIRQQPRQRRQADQPQRGQHVRRHHADPVADPVHHARRGQVHQQLHREVDRGDQRQLIQRQAELAGERQEQQRCEVVDDGLGHVADVAGVNGVVVILAYAHGRTSVFMITLAL